MQFFNPLSSRKSVTPEGHAGQNVFMFLPFYQYAYWSPSGRQLTFTNAEIDQKTSRPIQGITRPDTFRKDASACNGSPAVL